MTREEELERLKELKELAEEAKRIKEEQSGSEDNPPIRKLVRTLGR